ncbi:MAG: hypothetical protein JWN78_1554 [Bacteroidota bacterium]|nr:hypothetical protein [Bacteroidota bacterium]
MSDFSNIRTLAEEFENETLPKALWTYEAHLATGLYYVLNLESEAAFNKIRTNIKKYNLATGGENTETTGYHETITNSGYGQLMNFLAAQIRIYQLKNYSACCYLHRIPIKISLLNIIPKIFYCPHTQD